jgi:hypothetical protein
MRPLPQTGLDEALSVYELTGLADACLDADEEVHPILIEKVFPRQVEVASVANWEAALHKI